MSLPKAGIQFEIKRLLDFLKVFRRSKRGLLGIAIIVLFIFLAVGAPILTPYDPTAIHTLPKVAYRLCKPTWYKYLFPNENISGNIDLIPNPSFSTASGIEQLDFATTLTVQSSIHHEFASNIGYTEGSGPGSVAIKFRREADTTPYGEVTANLSKVFNYPYEFPPMQFQGQSAILIDNPNNITITINLILEKVGSERRIVWTNDKFRGGVDGWETPYPMIDSDNFYTRQWLGQTLGKEWSKNPAKQFFAEAADYKFCVEITLNDTQSGQSEATIYIDDFFLRLFGNSFGILGTDQYGRDIFTQLAYGARVSLLIGLLTAAFTTVIGLVVGLTAGYVGGYLDQFLMRLTDMLLVIPEVPLLLILVAVLGANIWNLILLMTILGWTGFARIARSQTLSLKERPFVEAAKALGGGRIHIIIRHILPNVMSLVYVTLATAVPAAIINEAWLAWLGLFDPTIMTWGRMLHDIEAEATGIYMWWWVIPPGICIAAISLSFILMGYALDEILNPKLRERR